MTYRNNLEFIKGKQQIREEGAKNLQIIQSFKYLTAHPINITATLKFTIRFKAVIDLMISYFVFFLLLFQIPLLGFGFELSDSEKAYKEITKPDSIVFRSTPVENMIPSSQTVIAAIKAETIDMDVASDSLISEDRYVFNPYGDKIQTSGYHLEPYAGLSLKNVAFGLAVEKGSRSFTRSSGVNIGEDSYTGNTSYSNIEYWGIGFNVYVNPFPKFKRIFWTFQAGGKLLNTTHKSQYEQVSNGDVLYKYPYLSNLEEWEIIKYTVTKMNLGSTFNIKLGSKIRLIPWVNYTLVDTEDLNFLIGEETAPKVLDWRTFYSDGVLFWNGRDPLSKGIDLSVKIKRFEFHLGDLIGGLYRSMVLKDARLLKDEGISLSFSYDFKAR